MFDSVVCEQITAWVFVIKLRIYTKKYGKINQTLGKVMIPVILQNILNTRNMN